MSVPAVAQAARALIPPDIYTHGCSALHPREGKNARHTDSVSSYKHRRFWNSVWGLRRGARGAGFRAWQLCAHSPSLGTSQPVSMPFCMSCRGETPCFWPRTAMACMGFPPAVCGRSGSGILPTTPPRERRAVRHGRVPAQRTEPRGRASSLRPPSLSPHLGDVSAVGACRCERRRRSSAVAGRWAPARRVACSIYMRADIEHAAEASHRTAVLCGGARARTRKGGLGHRHHQVALRVHRPVARAPV